MNEYLKKIYSDANKYMPHGKNGKMWNSGTWSNNHAMEEDEKLKWDKWLNGILISNQSKDFNDKLFEGEVIVYKRSLPKFEHLSSMLIYQEGEKMKLEPAKLNGIINETCLETNKTQNGIWFYGHQGDTYHYTINEFGTYTLKSLKTEADFVNYEANLEPLFANLINIKKHQTLENNIELISGIVSENKDWIILFTLKINEELKIAINGDRKFCDSINNKIRASR